MTNLKNINGILIDNIKNVNGIPKASIKNVNGFTLASLTNWTPAQLGLTLLKGWYDGSNSSGFTVDSNNKISQQNDLSGNNNHLLQRTYSLQPILSANSINSLSAVSYGGGTRMVLPTSLNTLFRTAGWSMYCMVMLNPSNTSQTIIGSNEQDGLPMAAQGNTSTNVVRAHGDSNYSFSAIQPYTNGAVTTATTRGTYFTEIVTNTAKILSYHNLPYFGSLVNDFLIGNALAAYGYSTVGFIGEMLITPSPLTVSDRQKVEGYMAWKWGTVSSLPINHPYKTSAPMI